MTLVLAALLAAVQTLGVVQALPATILSDSRLPAVAQKARQLLRGGFSAGAGIYSPVFIRDFNTFLPGSCEVQSPAAIKARLLPFLLLQGADGSIGDAYEETKPLSLKRSVLDGVVDPKGTVESDQESSLVQAVYKYVACTHDTAFLQQKAAGTAVFERLVNALDFVKRDKMDAARGLVFAGTTIDWGDVQAEDVPGASLNAHSHLAISIYPNAMYVIAIDDLLTLMKARDVRRAAWQLLRQSIASQVRTQLWDAARSKFKPHLYLTTSPFPAGFDENAIVFEGGTAVAIEAGLLSNTEIAQANAQMIDGQRHSGAFSMAGSIYPPYPDGYFKHPLLCEYCYQNGAAWQWFAGRMVRQLALRGMMRDAYDELQPMLDDVVRDGDFFEYYRPPDTPAGAPNFRGGAGVLLLAIEALQQAAHSASPSQFTQQWDNKAWSYAQRPPGFAWEPFTDPATHDSVYYGVAPPDAQPPLSPGDTVYVGPDSAFYYFKHAPPIRSADLIHRWSPLHAMPVE